MHLQTNYVDDCYADFNYLCNFQDILTAARGPVVAEVGPIDVFKVALSLVMWEYPQITSAVHCSDTEGT